MFHLRHLKAATKYFFRTDAILCHGAAEYIWRKAVSFSCCIHELTDVRFTLRVTLTDRKECSAVPTSLIRPPTCMFYLHRPAKWHYILNKEYTLRSYYVISSTTYDYQFKHKSFYVS